MDNHRFWPPRFSLRALMLAVLAIAVGLACFDAWRRVSDATTAAQLFDSMWDRRYDGVIRLTDLADAADSAYDADRRQWFSRHFACAFTELYITRLTRVELEWRRLEGTGFCTTKEQYGAAKKCAERVSRRIEEVQMQLNGEDR